MPSWKRTVYVLVVVHIITSKGFNVALPFLPLYVKQLKVVTTGDVVFWSGVVYSAPAFAMMIASPIWGWVADHYGHKIMLIRSTATGSIILLLMGFVSTVEELVILRILQGLFTGYIAAANALVSVTIPKEKTGESFGLLRSSIWIGTGLGPLLGGLFGDYIGFRQSFWMAGALLGVATIPLIFLIKENFTPIESKLKIGFFSAYAFLLRTPNLYRIYSLSFLYSLARSIVIPLIPLYILLMMGDMHGVSSITGVLFGLRSIVAALLVYFIGRMADIVGYGKMVYGAGIILICLYIPQPFLNHEWQLVAFQTLTGIASVGIEPGIGSLLSVSKRSYNGGATFGLDASIQSLARTLGPLIAVGIATLFGIRSAFGFIIIIYLIFTIITIPLRNTIKTDLP